jgi:hypothetical protein
VPKRVETHSAILDFADGVVRKRKKPLDLGFVDFRTVAARLAACEEEVRLNRRMAPDVYLGVESAGGDDVAVVMRALPAERSLSSLVRAGAEVGGALAAVAVQLSDLHRRYPAPAHLHHLGTAEHLRALWEVGLDALTPFEDIVPAAVRERTRALAGAWLAGRASLLQHRIDAGRLVEGHGDLQADDVFVLDDGPRVLDCLEFDQRLRVVDGVADASFLVMDLERLGAPRRAGEFFDDYLEAARDAVPLSFVHHHVAYRAHVRSKVTCVRARQDGRAETAALARDLAELALEHLLAGRVRLVLVGGLPGSGKSTVARALAAPGGARLLSSDSTRAELLGPAPGGSGLGDGLGTGRYGPDATARTYDALLRQAGVLLEGGESVVLDASFTDDAWRRRARSLGHETFSVVTELQCVVDEATGQTRLEARVGDVSEATPEVRRWLASRADPWPEADIVDNTGGMDAAAAQAIHYMGGSFGPAGVTVRG